MPLAPHVATEALDAIIMIDAGARVMQFKGAAERMFGYSPDEAIGRPLGDLMLPPDLAPADWVRMLRPAGGEPARMLDRRVELHARRRNGDVFPVELTLTQTSDDPLIWTGFVRDLTEHRRADRELHAHYAVDQAFRDWETFDEGVTSLLRRLGSALEYELGSLWVVDEKDGRLRCRSFWSSPGIDGGEFEVLTRLAALRPGEGMAGRAFDTARPILSEDLRRTDTALGRGTAASRMGLQAGLAIPVVGDDGPLAVLSYYSFERHKPMERLVRTLTTIGHELGRFLERRRADLSPRPISERELDVLRLAADGNTGPRIAAQLGLSPATVKTHFENIYDKLGVSDRAAAVAHAMRIGLIR